MRLSGCREHIAILAVLAAVLLTVLVSCAGNEPAHKRELLIYCGITMIKPMTEIAKIIEEEYNCKIHITKGGSGNLLKSLKANQLGDLYLPGSDSYIKTCIQEGLVTEAVHVGFNKAAMMTREGNPKNIPAALESLADPRYYVVIGDPDSGSIGRETKKILVKRGLFEQVVGNAKQLTTDSKDLIRVLKDKEADLVINWYATSTWPENRDSVSVLPIDDRYAQKKKLMLGLLRFSKHPDIAKAFMKYATLEKGREIFNKYGLYDVK
ncbi:substrate-binding domain-containing protein [Maridesulfovibrio sp.]|uniref:substrate-binding domain-containing protein n=1 Tax=Maridesulfovibrio sp. TaxID=2795000 RepID=UPI002A18CA32|nr:substrate-binding domain-containing protein [Maridesulfovibrio sp.]